MLGVSLCGVISLVLGVNSGDQPIWGTGQVVGINLGNLPMCGDQPIKENSPVVGISLFLGICPVNGINQFGRLGTVVGISPIGGTGPVVGISLFGELTQLWESAYFC